MEGGGTEKTALRLLSQLDRTRYKLKLILFNARGEFFKDLPEDIEILDLGKRNRWHFFSLIMRIRKIIKTEKPDVLLSFLFYTNIVTAFSAMFLKNRPRLIVSERNYHRAYLPFERFSWLKKIFLAIAYRQTDQVIAISRGIAKAVSEDFKVPAQKIRVIYNPVDLDEVRQLSRAETDCDFLNNKAAPVVITAGRLSRQKNFSLLIEAFTGVLKQMPAHLVILGKGELRPKLELFSKNLGIGGNLTFAGFQKNPFAWISKADLFVLTSSWEGFGNVITEAMACGIPVISTRCSSGPAEIITDNVDGLLVDPGDSRALTDAMIRLLKDKAAAERLSAAALNRIKDMSIEKITEEYENTFTDRSSF